MRDKITEILEAEFYSVYCDNCAYIYGPEEEDYNPCEDCHRKSMRWRLSHACAEELADKILNCIKEVEAQELKERYQECLEVLDKKLEDYM